MTKKPYGDIFEYRADDGKIFVDEDGVCLGTLIYWGKTITKVNEIEWSNLQKISHMMS